MSKLQKDLEKAYLCIKINLASYIHVHAHVGERCLCCLLQKKIFLYVRYHMLEKGLTKKNDRRMNYSMDEWWASLTVDEKERIATKVAGREVHYPECSVIWNKLDKEIQQKIHDHCTDVHGLELKEWDVNEMFSC